MLARVTVNVTMTVQPFYLNEVTEFRVTEENPTPIPLAVVPLITFILSMFFSIFIQRKMTLVLKDRMKPFLVSIFILTVSSVPLYFLNKDNRMWVYPLSAF